MSTYSEKLKDPRWQKRRLEAMQRDHFKCRQCGDDSSTLHVHHTYYVSGREPWQYPIGTLQTLCRDCHEAESASDPCWPDAEDDRLRWSRWEESASLFVALLRESKFDMFKFLTAINNHTKLGPVEIMDGLHSAAMEGRIDRCFLGLPEEKEAQCS